MASVGLQFYNFTMCHRLESVIESMKHLGIMQRMNRRLVRANPGNRGQIVLLIFMQAILLASFFSMGGFGQCLLFGFRFGTVL